MKRFVLCSALFLAACGQQKQRQQQGTQPGNGPATVSRPENFGADVAFLKEHTETILLKDSTSKAAIALAPAWQGRVMTSTVNGDAGRSLGWLNHDLIADGKPQPHINAYGGEDRFWIGPEGSRNSFYFAPGDSFDLVHWQVPAPLDTEPFPVKSSTRASVIFERDMALTNHKGNTFNIKVTRTVTLIARRDIGNYLGLDLPKKVEAVAYHSCNRITNTGKHKWDTAFGMPSVWMLGMFPASAQNTVIIPIRNGGPGKQPVNNRYFGKVPEERLRVNEKVVYFKADAGHRSKIGLPQDFVYNYLGSYDAEHHVLTIVQFSLPAGKQRYVNSSWDVRENPFTGDVINAYNDGPPGENLPQLGRFYELESSSPAAALKPGGNLEHYHRTIHLSGDEKHLEPIALQLFGISLKAVGVK